MIEIVPNWHPIVVHFSVALVLTSLFAYISANLLSGFIADECKKQLLAVARWNLWLGAVASVLTVAAGFVAFNSVVHDDISHKAMLEHRNWALVSVVLITFVAIWSWQGARRRGNEGKAFVLVFIMAGLCVVSTAWHGGELVYRYGLGVMSLPDVDTHDHAAHNHGEHHQDDEAVSGTVTTEETVEIEPHTPSLSAPDHHSHDHDHAH